MDLKLYHTTGKFPYDTRDVEELDNSLLSSPKVASRKEVLANKVLKFFLTEKGSDSFDRDYGSTAFGLTQIDRQYLPIFKLELNKDVQAALSYFNKREKTGERIAQIIIKDVRYIDKVKDAIDKKIINTPMVAVVLEVVTTKSNRASITITK